MNLLLAYFVLKAFFRSEFHCVPLLHSQGPIRDPRLATACRFSLVLLVILVVAKVIVVTVFNQFDFRITYIALVSAAPILIYVSNRRKILRSLDWHTLIFFASMFVLMESVWDTGFFQSIIAKTKVNLLSIPAVLGVSVLLSQFISNVPLVAPYLPMMMQMGATSKDLVVLAAGSTIAGNLSILGAASNVIIIQNAEKSGETLSFWEFFRVGLPLTILNAAVYWIFLTLS